MVMTKLLKNNVLFHEENTGEIENGVLFNVYSISYVIFIKYFWKDVVSLLFEYVQIYYSYQRDSVKWAKYTKYYPYWLFLCHVNTKKIN